MLWLSCLLLKNWNKEINTKQLTIGISKLLLKDIRQFWNHIAMKEFLLFWKSQNLRLRG